MDLMAIDLGSSSVKVTITDSETGEILAFGKQGYYIMTPKHGWIESDPSVWWTSTVLAIKECLGEYSKDSSQIAAIGFSGQMHGVIPVDANGHELYNCIMYSDSRSNSILDRIPEDVKTEMESKAYNPVTSMMSAPKLLWLRLNEPDIWKNTSKWLMPKDYLRMKLTGDISTDISDASGTSMMNYSTYQWLDCVEKLGLELKKFPTINKSHEIVSTISKSVEILTGLKAGTPVVCGAADMACTALGTGAIGHGTASITIGTAGHTIVAMDKVDKKNINYYYQMCHAIPGLYYAFGPILSGGINLSWFRDRLSEVTEDLTFSQMESYAIKAEPGCSGLYFLPYLAGSVIPDADPDARGAFVGLSLQHTMPDLIRSIMEGVSYAFKNIVDVMIKSGVIVDRYILGEGGSKSKLWCMILASMLGNKECAVVHNKDSAPVGATILAGMGIGAYKDWNEAVAKLSNASPVQQDEQMANYYEKGFEIYKMLYPANKELLSKINKL